MSESLSYAGSPEDDLAQGWEWSTLGDVTTIQAGNPAPQGKQFFTGGSYPFVRVYDMGKLDGAVKMTRTRDLINDNATEKLKLFPAGSVLFTKSGASTLLNQRAILAQDCHVVSHIAASLPGDRVTSEWVYYWMKTVDFGKLAHGANMPSLQLAKAKKIPIPVAPLEDQRRIVAEIEKQLSRLDEAVASLKRVKANLKRYKAAVLKAAVEGKLTEEWRKQNPDVEPASKLLERILAERRTKWEEAELTKMKAKGKEPKDDKWKEKLKDPVFDISDTPFDLPEGWVWTSVDALLYAIEAGKSFKCEERPPVVGEAGVVKVSAVSWGQYLEQESKTCHDSKRINSNLVIQEGDFIFSRANTIELVGACVIVKSVELDVMLSDKILRLGIVSKMKDWLLLVLRSSYGRSEIERLATGNQDSMRNIGQARIRSIRLPLPPATEVAEILAITESSHSVSGHAETIMTASVRQATSVRKSILGTIYSGKKLYGY